MATSKIRADSLQLQDRDFAVLRGLFECRVMTTAHATTLYFVNKIDAANKRLQRLKAAGLISERPRRTFEPSVLFLTRKGLTLLQEQGVLTQYQRQTARELFVEQKVRKQRILADEPAG